MNTAVEQPHIDMPADVVADYTEAALIFSRSPRGSAALLRLAMQKLCVHLGGSGANLNADIGELVQNGLPVIIQQSLDVVRVIGNNAVHPGEIDIRDNSESAGALFKLMNLIVDNQIAEPERIQKLYDSLPESARNAVDRRDS
ncbi:MAG: DUF4145 domain-containing protein [Pseudomonadota bacterium]